MNYSYDCPACICVFICGLLYVHCLVLILFLNYLYRCICANACDVELRIRKSKFGELYIIYTIHKRSPPKEIKKAYYNCMKACHPDLSGNDPETTNFCMFINEVYTVLSDPVQRMIYDEIHGYALTAINPFLDDSCLKDLAFVDEFSCIGCKNCANVAPDVFSIEEDFGRARVYNQGGDPELVQQAIDSCPVDCIHWTSAPQLSLLEDEMRRVERVNVAMMLSGMNISAVDVFRMASSRWQKRQAKVLNYNDNENKMKEIREKRKRKRENKKREICENFYIEQVERKNLHREDVFKR
ncbi:hypothetical protein UlMin_036024 [Ulmus minor]